MMEFWKEHHCPPSERQVKDNFGVCQTYAHNVKVELIKRGWLEYDEESAAKVKFSKKCLEKLTTENWTYEKPEKRDYIRKTKTIKSI